MSFKDLKSKLFGDNLRKNGLGGESTALQNFVWTIMGMLVGLAFAALMTLPLNKIRDGQFTSKCEGGVPVLKTYYVNKDCTYPGDK